MVGRQRDELSIGTSESALPLLRVHVGYRVQQSLAFSIVADTLLDGRFQIPEQVAMNDRVGAVIGGVLVDAGDVTP